MSRECEKQRKSYQRKSYLKSIKGLQRACVIVGEIASHDASGVLLFYFPLNHSLGSMHIASSPAGCSSSPGRVVRFSLRPDRPDLSHCLRSCSSSPGRNSTPLRLLTPTERRPSALLRQQRLLTSEPLVEPPHLPPELATRAWRHPY